MTFAEVLCDLRQLLLDAKDRNDNETLVELRVTFTILREISYGHENRRVTGILVTLVDCARDFSRGMGWKEQVPSIEVIRSALSSDNSP